MLKNLYSAISSSKLEPKTVLVNNYAMYTSRSITHDETVDYSSTSGTIVENV